MTRNRPYSFFSEARRHPAASILRQLGYALLCVVFAASPLAAQSPKPSQKTAPPSPYLIESLIDINDELDLKQVWRMLNIEPPTDMSYRCEGGCEAETFDLATGNEDGGKTVALRISLESHDFYQYLVFRQAGSGEWKLLGSVDCHGQRYGPPAYRIEQGDGRTWLVVRELTGRGTDMVVYDEGWHEVRDDGVKEVLSYPVEGEHQPYLASLGRSYKAVVLRHDLENGVYTIPVQFMITYNISANDAKDTPLSLFARGLKAYYVWNPAQGEFVLDERRSEVTAKQLANACAFEGFSKEAFLEDNFTELAEIATRGDARRKAWLKRFLTSVKDTPRKADLQRLLQQ